MSRQFNAKTEDMIFYGFRYCLGRKTYAVANCVDYLIANWNRISAMTRTLMQKEIRVAIERGRCGMEMDKRQWERVLELTM
jgi:hypothetical protein